MTPHLHGKPQAGLQPRRLASPRPSAMLFPLKISLQITFLDVTASFWPARCPGDPDWGHSPGVGSPCPRRWGGSACTGAACGCCLRSPPTGAFHEGGCEAASLNAGHQKSPNLGNRDAGKIQEHSKGGPQPPVQEHKHHPTQRCSRAGWFLCFPASFNPIPIKSPNSNLTPKASRNHSLRIPKPDSDTQPDHELLDLCKHSRAPSSQNLPAPLPPSPHPPRRAPSLTSDPRPQPVHGSLNSRDI